MKKRIVSLLLALALVCSLLPVGILAAEEETAIPAVTETVAEPPEETGSEQAEASEQEAEADETKEMDEKQQEEDETVVLLEATPVTAKVDYTAQAGGAFLCAPQFDVTVSSDLAEKYGYTDQIGVADGVSALDVLVKAHEEVFGASDFAENHAGYLAVTNTGSITTIFGTETVNCGFAVNGAAVVDTGTQYPAGYGMPASYAGKNIAQSKVSAGDTVEFFVYEDESGLDYYSWFADEDGRRLSEVSVIAGQDLDLSIKGYYYGWYGCAVEADKRDGEALVDSGDCEDLPIVMIDKDGAAVAFSPETAADEDGAVTVKFADAGEYLLAIQGDESVSVVSALLKVTVTPPPTPTSIKVDPDYKRMADGKIIAAKGDSFQMHAYDKDGNDISADVVWSNQNVGAIDPETGLFTVTSDLTTGSSSYLYVTATSKYDPAIKYETRPAIQVAGWHMSSNAQNATVALSADGQTAKTGSVGAGGCNGHNGWTWEIPEGVGEVQSDPGTSTRVTFKAYRPGVISATVTVDLDDGMTQTGTLTITGVAVEDAAGNRGKTYLEITGETPEPTVQLAAFCEAGKSVASWTSADETVATVDENGIVTAKSVGTAIITATDNNGAKGGIKVVVSNDEVPAFEALEFLTSAFKTGTWTTGKTYAPTTMEYDLPIRTYSTSQLTLQATTLYDTKKYTAAAAYTDLNGAEQKIEINSGTITYLKDIPFDDSDVVITLASKEEGGKSAVYTFHVTRPRDTTKTIKNTTGAVLVPEGRNLLATKYKNQPEGAIFRAGNNGEPTATTGTTGTVYFYRTYAQNGLEQFRMTFTGNTVYEHLRYSVDDGETWTELGQNFGTTDAVSFPDSGVVKVTLQILDDATYAANDGFDGGEPNVYTFWVERLPAVEEGALPYILTAETGFGDWYPAFNKEWIGNYNVVVPNGTAAADAPVLTYTVAEGAVVKLGTKDQTPDEHGVYTLKLTASNQTLNITSADGSYTNSYGFKYQSKSKYDVPDKVVDFLCVNSQYTNVSFGIMPETTLSGSLKSTGNWGGYITYYYENGLKDDPNNRYGVDFYIYGNSNINNADGTKKSFAEPGQVWVSEDGESWYALAGSEHYNEDTVWDYAVIYRKSASGRTAWVDNQGNSNDGVSQCGLWVDPQIYYMNDLAKSDSFTLTGIVLPGESGKITGSADNMYAKDIQFGYVDAFPNGTIGAEVNPYMENPANSNGFDLAWAVDDAGLPVDVSGKEFHYVKIVTASNIWASGINEKSTEVTQMIRTAPAESAVGKTALPKAVVVSDGVSNRSFSLEEGKQVYDLDVGDMKYVALSLDGAAADDNIYFNNLRSDKLEGVKVTKEGGGKLVRLIVQNGEKEPAVLLLRLTGSAEESDGLIEGIKVAVGGSVRQAKTKDGQTYSLTVGSRIETVSVSVVTAGSVRIDGEEPAEEYPLQEGANTFSIEVEDGEKTQTVSLVVTREAAPEASGREITVTFSLYGDEMHDEETVHTYQKTSGQLQRWIAPTRYTTAAESTVLDVFETALRAAGYAWTNDGGNYISEINGLAEFTNGSRSGWMYLLNGNHPDFGVAEQKLKNGDVIVFHYTDDYTQEEGSQRFRSGSAASVGEEKNDAAASGGTSARFTDVPDGAWYEDAVNFAADHELMNGTGETTFSPDATMSRSMLMMVLARMAGEDTAKGENWYDVGMAWAKENGISDGTDPEADITREQMMTMLYRYVQKQGGGFTGTWMFRLEYNDRDNVSQWAYEAVCWCTSNGIVNGMSGGMLNPQGTATRAQVAAILARFAQLDNA